MAQGRFMVLRKFYHSYLNLKIFESNCLINCTYSLRLKTNLVRTFFLEAVVANPYPDPHELYYLGSRDPHYSDPNP